MLMDGKTALVTGAAAGIGEVIARLFCAEGAHVWLLDCNLTRMETVHDSLRKAGAEVSMLAADLRRPDQLSEAIDRIHGRVQALDVLVNNAGVYPRQDFLEMKEEQWREVIDINLNGAYRCTRLVAPRMATRGAGKIIFISSVTFHWGLERLTHYVASKGGLIGLTRSLARELGPRNVHVNCITPGAVETEAEARIATPEQIEEVVKLQSLRRRIVPLDVARACVFLATEWSDGLTGQTLNVDGGWMMH
jgi:3-oxoacyl-[acyl-carrier protein] reductase